MHWIDRFAADKPPHLQPGITLFSGKLVERESVKLLASVGKAGLFNECINSLFVLKNLFDQCAYYTVPTKPEHPERAITVSCIHSPFSVSITTPQF